MNAEDKDLMEKLLSTGHLEQKYAQRLQTILLRARGKKTNEIGDFLNIHPCTVSLYINRYNTSGITSLLHDKTRKPGNEPVD
jgi:DNA-binding NarL/FixJ family response regulator